MMKNARVLVVEDEALVAMEIEETLGEIGYQVVGTVDSGEKAVQKVALLHPDLVLMDIRLKGEMDGINAAELIRNQGPIAIIFITAFSDEEKVKRAKLAMPVGYLIKPVGRTDLRVAIEMALYAAESDKKRDEAELQLKASEKKYRNLVNNLHEGVWVIDHNDLTTFVNPRMAEMLGYTEEEMLGRHLFSFMRDHDKEISRQNTERRKQGVREQYDFDFRRKDGSYLETSVEASPLTDDDGIYVGAIRGVFDISHRKKWKKSCLSPSNRRNKRTQPNQNFWLI